MIDGCSVVSSTELFKLSLVIISLAASAIFLVILKLSETTPKKKIGLIYSHILTILFPLILLTTSSACAMTCASCYNNVLHLLALTLPATLLVGTVTGFILIPTAFIFFNKKGEIKHGEVYKFVKISSKKVGIKQPRVFTINRQYPIAFSFRKFKSAIFLSVGLFDILAKKETEAVILHEMGHIKNSSSALKLSGMFLKVFSPFSLILKFNYDDKKEERKADIVAAKIQKTDRYLKSARKKIDEYDK